MNYQISKNTKDLLSGVLINSGLLIASIPDALLNEEMKALQEQTLHELQEVSRRLDGALPAWEDMESDVHKN